MVNPRFGPVQKGTLTDAIIAAYGARENTERQYPDFRDVLGVVESRYAQENKSVDTLIETLKDLAQFRLFWDHDVLEDPLSDLTRQTIIVDLHALPVLRELVAYLAIERLYKEMASLPDSAISDGRREIRTVLVLDEAHNYLPQKNLFLQRVVREGRSKGVAVFFASQSPSDYAQKSFDFKELLEFFFMFQCDGLNAGDVQELLGCSPRAARELQGDIPRLRPLEAVSKPMAKGPEYIRFTAEPFYKAY